MPSRRKPKRRIEPRFEEARASRRSADFSVSDDDRAAPPRRRSKAKRKSSPARAPKKRTARGRTKARRGFFGLVGGLVYWTFILGIWGGIAAAGVVLWYGAQLPSATTWQIPDRPPNVKIVSAGGSLIANRGATGGEAVGLHQMSPHIAQAAVAIEDRRFYSHFGVDPLGLARAMATNVAHRRLVQGGSTITQQLAKNLFLTADRTIGRKVQEVLLALWLERKYTKNQILEMYLNRVYFGSGSYGVEAASRRYFDKSARDVTLSEAALLAGLLKAPSRLSPARNPQLAEKRAQVVLAAMRDQGMVSDSEMTAALTAPATRAAAYWTGSEHYVADAVMEELPLLVGEIGRDLVVETTVELSLQKFAEETIRDLIAAHGEKGKVSQGALVSIDNSGAVRAMVGGYDYANSQFDRATEARRQPGSAFKPFVFQTALEQGRTPDSVRNDAPVRIGKWTPENYNGKYYGPVTLETALAKSLNSVAAQLIVETGAANVVATARRMGIESDLTANASLALGTSEVTLIELTSAYVPFANGGFSAEPFVIRRVTSLDGKVLYEHPAGRGRRVVDARVAGMMNAMMSRTLTDGTGRAAAFSHPAAGKTGTSQNSRDAWFIGYTGNFTTGIWFGNDNASPTNKITGGSLPALAWKAFMQEAHRGLPVAPLPGYSDAIAMPTARPQNEVAARPLFDVGGARSSRAEPRPEGDLAPPKPDSTTTASTGAPRPKVGVGQERTRGGGKTVMDILLGR
ncbi:transglycosylase domain-containing protein [Oricola cellulosilytica]|uniref:Penicillin-binding protein n=1 Tax=Oricola cellulosilytica TaxID=1429082 RepID=A0A4R0PEZ1_9HYPH|nr:transglycosylase domain-containing protein [Oricola cellulosilytica]TCD16385.1 penicillin-binding protein [Oricola cellulosilytica]